MIPAAPPAGAQGYGQGYGQGYNQGYGRPPAPVGGGYDDDGRGGGSDDAAGLTVRIDKLENQMRQLNGQIEQLQFANRRLEDQLKKFEGDVDFRLQDLGHAGGGAKPQRRGDVGDGTTPPTSAAVDVAPPAAAPAPARARRGDAFDPAADPAAVGAPRPIGSLPATGASREAALADAGGGDAPLDLSGGRLRGSAGAAGAPPVPLNAGGTAPRPGAAPTVTPGDTVIAGAAPSGPKEEFDQALGYYKDKQYDTAEKGFAALIQKNPKARIAPDAIYYLGETYYQRGRPARGGGAISQDLDGLRVLRPRARGHAAARPGAERARRQGAGLRHLRRDRPQISECGKREIGRRAREQAPPMPGQLTHAVAATAGARDLHALFAPLAAASGCVLAVSGGPDSLALLHLAARWAQGTPGAPPLHVATVDHGLRPEGRAEAAAVAAVAARAGLPHATLCWQPAPASSRLQERARAARYDLLRRHAQALGADHIATAHHADDQAETILFRLLRGSGLAGLGGMRTARRLGAATLVRPLLDLTKEDLAAVCRAAGLAPVDDPSNADPLFARTRLRQMAPTLATLGLDRAALLRLGRRAARADRALEVATDAARAGLPALGTADTFATDAAAVLRHPDEIVLRLLAGEIARLGDDGPLRLERLERLCAGLREAVATSLPFSGTLAGTLLRVDSRGRLTIRRMPPRRTGRP